jgi:hypothetical protein
MTNGTAFLGIALCGVSMCADGAFFEALESEMSPVENCFTDKRV